MVTYYIYSTHNFFCFQDALLNFSIMTLNGVKLCVFVISDTTALNTVLACLMVYQTKDKHVHTLAECNF